MKASRIFAGHSNVQKATPAIALPCVLILTRNLPPLVGGMERLVWHIIDEMRLDYRVHVVAPAGSGNHLPTDVTISEVPLRPLPWFFLCTKLAALWWAMRRRPRIVLAGSGLTAPFAWLAARLIGAKCAVYLHGLDVETEQPLYRLFWRPFFRHIDHVLVNSLFTQQLAINAGVRPGCLRILPPGIHVTDMSDTSCLRAAFRKRHRLGDARIMLYVGRITARKGLAAFVETIFPKVAAAVSNTRLITIGDEPASALRQASGQCERIGRALERAKLKDRAHFLGEYAQDHPELDAAYFAADVLVFPVQYSPGDNEGFGMVAIEAAAHGLPTVAFAAGGVPDAVADGVSGRLIRPGDNDGFAKAVIEVLTQPDTWAERSARIDFARKFAWPKFGEQLRALLGMESP